MSARPIDLSGPDGNVYAIAGLAQAWNRQIGNERVCILKTTTRRLQAETPPRAGFYDDILDTFDEWFKGKIDYEFLNDPRLPSNEEDDE